MNIHPKSIYKKPLGPEEGRGFYKKESDQEILEQMKAVISIRPSYE
jgi:hypothetical protein